MANQVTERFIACHDILKSRKIVKSSRQFAITIGTLPQSLNEVLKGNRDATVKNLVSLVGEYGISEKFLLGGEGPMFQSEIPTVTLEEGKIAYVPTPAYAGDMDQYIEDVKEEDVERFHIPGYNTAYGEHRCFDVAGNSMEPTLHSGDQIICSRVPSSNNYNCVKDNYIYVIVTANEILVKRVINQIDNNQTLKLISDNASDFRPINIPIQEVREIWRVNKSINNVLPSSPKQNELLVKIDDLQDIIKKMIDQQN